MPGVYVEGIAVSDRNQLQSAAQIKTWLNRYPVAVLRLQALTPIQQRELVQHFGPLFLHHSDDGVIYADGISGVLEMRKEPDAARLFGGSDWHADVSFRKPAAYV